MKIFIYLSALTVTLLADAAETPEICAKYDVFLKSVCSDPTDSKCSTSDPKKIQALVEHISELSKPNETLRAAQSDFLTAKKVTAPAAKAYFDKLESLCTLQKFRMFRAVMNSAEPEVYMPQIKTIAQRDFKFVPTLFSVVTDIVITNWTLEKTKYSSPAQKEMKAIRWEGKAAQVRVQSLRDKSGKDLIEKDPDEAFKIYKAETAEALQLRSRLKAWAGKYLR